MMNIRCPPVGVREVQGWFVRAIADDALVLDDAVEYVVIVLGQ
jgi:hypothetical protein